MDRLSEVELRRLIQDLGLFGYVVNSKETSHADAPNGAAIMLLLDSGHEFIRDLYFADSHAKLIQDGQRPHLFNTKSRETRPDFDPENGMGQVSAPLVAQLFFDHRNLRLSLTPDGESWFKLAERLADRRRELFRFLKLEAADFSQFGRYRISPYASAWLVFFADLYNDLEKNSAFVSMTAASLQSIVTRHLDSFVAGMRSKEFKQQIKGYQRSGNKNISNYIDYIDGLCSHYPRMHILRLDFGYSSSLFFSGYYDPTDKREEFLQNARKTDAKPVHKQIEEIEQVAGHRDALIKCLNKVCKSSRLGYIWRIFHNVTEGYRLHLILFLRDHHSVDPRRISRELGQAWAAITENMGLYNGYEAVPTEQQNYRNAGVGLFVHGASGWETSRTKMLQFLVGLEHLLVLKLPEKEHAIGRGHLPKPPKAGDPVRRLA